MAPGFPTLFEETEHGIQSKVDRSGRMSFVAETESATLSLWTGPDGGDATWAAAHGDVLAGIGAAPRTTSSSYSGKAGRGPRAEVQLRARQRKPTQGFTSITCTRLAGKDLKPSLVESAIQLSHASTARLHHARQDGQDHAPTRDLARIDRSRSDTTTSSSRAAARRIARRTRPKLGRARSRVRRCSVLPVHALDDAARLLSRSRASRYPADVLRLTFGLGEKSEVQSSPRRPAA